MLNYKTDKFILRDIGQTSGILGLINEPLIPTLGVRSTRTRILVYLVHPSNIIRRIMLQLMCIHTRYVFGTPSSSDVRLIWHISRPSDSQFIFKYVGISYFNVSSFLLAHSIIIFRIIHTSIRWIVSGNIKSHPIHFSFSKINLKLSLTLYNQVKLKNKHEIFVDSRICYGREKNHNNLALFQRGL